MRTLASTILLGLALLTPIGLAHASPPAYDEIVGQLGLSPDQKTKVEDIIYTSKSARADIQARLERARLDLRHSLSAPTLDERAVNRASEALADATGALIHNRVEQAMALRKVLSVEQFDALEGMWRGRRGGEHADRPGDRLRERFRDNEDPPAPPR